MQNDLIGLLYIRSSNCRMVAKRHGRATMASIPVLLLDGQKLAMAEDTHLNDASKIASPSRCNLALYEADIQTHDKVTSLLSRLTNYESVIPPSDGQQQQQQVTRLGTLSGVYLPCLQNIFGVILFLRLPWIVGCAGIVEAFMVVFLCCACTFLTAISMSAIATNGVVPAGGSYFMISRSLGPEFGGAVGLLFYIGTTFASSMYILGAVEILLTYMSPRISVFGDLSGSSAQSLVMLNNMRVYGTCLLMLMGLMVFLGVKLVNRFASFFLATVLISIAAIYVGFCVMHVRELPRPCYVDGRLLSRTAYTNCDLNDTKLLATLNSGGQPYLSNETSISRLDAFPGFNSKVFIDNLLSSYLQKDDSKPQVRGRQGDIVADITTSFPILLAIFFPSVTGIMAGSNRSGNLKNAQRAIPRGTLGAIATTSTVYLTCVILFGATINGDMLRDKFGASIGGSLIAANVAWPNEWVILVGAFLSTVGAGLQSLTGAPRLLQAIASDDLVPFLSVFASLSKKGEPSLALLATLILAEIGIVIASLDSVAPVITMFLLMCYFFVNFACTLQSILKMPNWRPNFKYYHWQTSTLGMLLCLGLMFVSSWLYSLVAIVIAAFIYKYVEFKGAQKEWGDGLQGLSLSAAKFGLMKLQQNTMKTKSWRPQLLLLCQQHSKEDTTSLVNEGLIQFANQLKAGKGLIIIGATVTGDYLHCADDVIETKMALKEICNKQRVKGFFHVIASEKQYQGNSYLLQGAGLGGLVPNTVISSWPEKWRESEAIWDSFMHLACTSVELEQALIVVKDPGMFASPTNQKAGRYIDVWWIVHDGGLMLLVAFLLRKHNVWKNSPLRVFTIAQLEDNSILLKQSLEKFLNDLRIPATVEIIEMFDSDITAYAYEKTLKMEQRNEMLSQLAFVTKIDSHHSKVGSQRLLPLPKAKEGTGVENTKEERNKNVNLRRMNTAVKLNTLIKEKSSDACLRIVNLPTPSKNRAEWWKYLEFIDALTEDVDHLLLIRGTGHEVVTIYS